MNARKGRGAVRRAIWIACLLAFAGCQRPPASEPLSIGLAPSLTSTLDIIADSEGFFEREGLAVTIHEFPSGKDAMDAMLAGKIDLASSAGFPVVSNSFVRKDFQVIATVCSGANDNDVVARADAGIRAIRDLRGKRVGVMQGTMAQYTLDMLLHSDGLTGGDIVESFGNPDQLAERLGAGHLDAVCVLGAAVDKARSAAGAGAVVFRDERLIRITTCVTARRSTIAGRPAALGKALRAYIRAERFVHEHPDRALAIVAARFNRDTAVAAAYWKPHMFSVSLGQALLIDLESLARWQLERGLRRGAAIPAYLDFVSYGVLAGIDPKRVTIVH